MGLLDPSVRFVPGFFSDSLPSLRRRLQRIAILRIDCDMYMSTMEVLCNLYDRIEPRGFWIADDWNVGSARRAVWDFIRSHNITERPLVIGPSGDAVWFEK